MLSAQECRAKASDLTDRVRCVSDPAMIAAYESTALEWLALSRTADVQEQLARTVAGRA